MIECRAIYRLVLITMAGLSAAGCATGKAQVLDQPPSLVVPPVPPRAIEPPMIAEAPPIEPLPEVVAAPATTAKPSGRVNRNTKPEPEPKPEPTVESPPPTAPSPVAALRTAATPSGPEAARQIRDAVDRANAVLNRVDVQKLSEDRKANYRAAKNYIEQASDALKKDDLALARSFAERAENIAKQLEPGR
jgi:hypothetical protein